MSTGLEFPTLTASPPAPAPPTRDEGWYRAAKRARQLSWASLVWMSVEGIVGLLSGFEANSLSLIVWAASSFVEGLASVTIIWRFTGSRARPLARGRPGAARGGGRRFAPLAGRL